MEGHGLYFHVPIDQAWILPCSCTIQIQGRCAGVNRSTADQPCGLNWLHNLGVLLGFAHRPDELNSDYGVDDDRARFVESWSHDAHAIIPKTDKHHHPTTFEPQVIINHRVNQIQG